MTSITWLHISDLHTGGDTYGIQYLGEHLSRFLREKRETAGVQPDFIIFSGDIANKGKANEYTLFNDRVLFPIIDLYGDSILNSLIFVPGNHDVDRACNPLIDSYSISEKHLNIFDCSPVGLALRQGLVDRFSAYRAALPTAQDNDVLFGEAAHFVRTFTIKNIPVGVVGINTAWYCQSDHDKNQLNAGRYGLIRGLDSIASCELKIVVGHHPTSWMKESEKEAMEAILAQHNGLVSPRPST